MSERAPQSTPETPAAAPETGVPNPDIQQSLHDVQAGLDANNAPEQQTPTPEADPFSLSPEEAAAKVRFQELRLKIDEKATPYINKAGNLADKAGIPVDRLTKKALMLEQRRTAKDKKIVNLRAKLDKSRPGSARERRLRRKLAMTHINRGVLNDYITYIDGSADRRAGQRPAITEAREKQLEVKRHMLIVAKKVAAEKKRRAKVESERYHTSDKARRQQLKVEIATWNDKEHIKRFESKLIEEVNKKMFPNTGAHH